MQVLRRGKLDYLLLAITLAAVSLLVFVLVSRNSSGGEANASLQEKDIRRTEALLAGIPQHGAALGDPKAPVTLQFFGDLQCGQSRQAMLGALPFLIRHWVRASKLRIVYRSLEIDTPERSVFLQQQIAALAAGQQERMWTFIELFYRAEQPDLATYAAYEPFIREIAEQAGVRMPLWAEGREADGWAREVESDEVMAETREMETTPSFLIGPTGGDAKRLRHFSLEEPVVFDEAIRETLSGLQDL